MFSPVSICPLCKLQPVNGLTFSCTKIRRQKEQLLIAVGVSGEGLLKGGSLQGNRHDSMCMCVFLHWPICSLFIVSTYIQSQNGCSHQTKSNKTCRPVYVNAVPRETCDIILTFSCRQKVCATKTADCHRPAIYKGMFCILPVSVVTVTCDSVSDSQ
jgi:hypothetical protein